MTQMKGSERRTVVTPYAATKLVNKELARAGVVDPSTGRPKTIGSPMLYIYADQGKFQRTRADDGRWDIDAESFHAWLEGYIERALERQQLAEELADPDTAA